MDSPKTIIRTAGIADAPELARFNEAMAWETEQKRLDPVTVRRGVEAALGHTEHGFYLVAEQHATVVAGLLITYEWSDWRCARFWWIQSVYVKPAFRQQGIFRQLYTFAKDLANRESNVCGLRLYAERSNRQAQNTYLRLGMEKTGYEVFEQCL